MHLEDNRSLSMNSPSEHSSVGRDMHYDMQGSGFEPRTSHLFTLKKVNLATWLLDKNKKKLVDEHKD
jgi:hypothetical protein